MKTILSLLSAALLLARAGNGLCAIHYVDLDSANPTPPYTTWANAATNIQDAVDIAVAGDEIVVTNGIYATGGRSVDGLTTNRVAVDKPISLRSVNGPQITIIDGGQSNRCVHLTHGASLSGFTLRNGRAVFGGGLFCPYTNALVSNCVISGNLVANPEYNRYSYGGGAYGGTLNNCLLTGNSSAGGYGGGQFLGHGGGASEAVLNNCTLTGNTAASTGGGAAGCTLNNCTLAGNSAQFGGGAAAGTLNNCIVYFNHSAYGTNYDSYTILNYSCTRPLPTNGIGNIAFDPLFVDTNGWSGLRLQSNSPCINAGNNAYAVGSTDLDGNPRINRGTVDMGAYEFQAGVHYVDVNGTNATPPYTTWATAATNVQDAVDAAVAGDEVLVTNGIYATGGRATISDPQTNRVTVEKSLILRSATGPRFTVIDGGDACRCLYLASGASISGFTLTHGAAFFLAGGVRCESATAVISNCIIASNNAVYVAEAAEPFVFCYGGGAAGGTLVDCILTHNSARIEYWCPGNVCHTESLVAGGGATGSTLINCVLVDNSAVFRTPASHNVVGYLSAGGGAWGSTLVNCTLTGNWAGSYGGGAGNSTINNSIILDGAASSTLNHCWTNAPLFVDETNGNLRLQSNSPCINAGNNAYAPAGPDLDGNLRIRGGTVDIGAYEFQAPVSQISYAWLQHYGLPVNAFTDSSDPDGDGVDNYQEWLARSDPTNPFSFPPLLTLIPYGANIFLIWPTNAVGFTLQSTTNLNPPIIWNTNSPGPVVIGNQNVVINPASNPRQFYRLVHLVKRASNENTHQ